MEQEGVSDATRTSPGNEARNTAEGEGRKSENNVIMAGRKQANKHKQTLIPKKR